MLTFIEERRQRIRKARAEALEILRRDPRVDAIIRDDPEIRKMLRNLGIEPRDWKNDVA